MKTAIVSCKTLETELTAAIARTGVDYPVEWLESGLHNLPKKLNAKLSEVLSGLDADRVLLGMGYCGNSIAGLTTGDFELIVPRVDDCITLLLGSSARRAEIARELSAYFLTEGWMRGERNLWVEYQYSIEKYGEEMAQELAEMMYAHYRTLALLDTGLEDINALLDKTKIIADTLHLEQKVLPASVHFLEELLTGPWEDGRYLIVPPHTTIAAGDLTLTT